MAEDENNLPGVTEEQIEGLQETIKLRAEELRLAQQAAQAAAKSVAEILKSNDALNNSQQIQELISAQKAVIAAKTEEERKTAEANLFIAREEVAENANKIEGQQELLALLDDELEARREVNAQADDLANLQNEVLRGQEAINNAARLLSEQLNEAVGAMRSLANQAQSLADVGTAGLFTQMSTGVAGAVQAFYNFGTQLDQTQVELARTTGFADQLQQPLKDMTDQGYEFGLGMQDNAEILGGLAASMTTFAMVMDGPMSNALMETAQELKTLGVDSSEFGASLDNLTRTMGFNAEQALAQKDTFIELGKSLKLPTGDVINDFNKLSPQLAKFGKDGLRVFESLSKQARSLGVTVEEAFDITNQLDTFEGSAQMIGTINAQLGIQLNSVELMAATDEKRLEMLTHGIREGMGLAEGLGKKFDDLHRREQQAIAEMLGVPVGTAARLLGDPQELEKYNKEQAEANARREAFVSITERLSTAGERLMVTFEPVFNLITSFAELLATPFVSGALMAAGVLLGLAKTAGFLYTAFTSLTAAMQAYGLLNTVLMALGLKTEGQLIAEAAGRATNTTAIGTETAAKSASIGPTVAAGQASAAAAGGMMSFALAVLAIGAGIGIAAAGLSLLVSSFAELNGEQMLGAILSITTLTVGFYAMIPALTSFATAAALSAAPIGGLGLALLSIGTGMALASVGFALLLNQFGELSTGFEALAGAKASLQSVAEIITVVKEADSSSLTQLDTVMKSIAEVGVSMSTTDNQNMKALTDAIKSLGGGGGVAGASGEQKVVLKIYDYEFGEIVNKAAKRRNGGSSR